ncbi:SPT16 protein, partial [Bucorvus abyssinicus]|nr:SPT16 protein [Bucorvus abyssinicus]
NLAANKLSDTPEAPQEVKIHLGCGGAENIMERRKKAEKRKVKQSNCVDKARHKRKRENDEKPAVEKEETKVETGSWSSLKLLFDEITLINPMDIETELVYTDKEDIFFEFTNPAVPLPCIHKQLQMTLQKGSTYYRQEKYAAALQQFSAALKLCSQGTAIDNPSESSAEDISSIASFIETKLVICYLKLKKPDDALNHAHRSIILNPAYFRNHLRQAAVFRCLKRYSEAARSAMIADYIYCLTGGTEQHTSKLIRLYWQAMIEEAITEAVSFSVLYTPFVVQLKADKINKINNTFAKKYPHHVDNIYTDLHRVHFLPQTTQWLSAPPQQYLLTLGFSNKDIGNTFEKWSSQILPIFSEREAPLCSPTKEAAEIYWNRIGQHIVPIIDFVNATKLVDYRCVCSRGIEKLHYASLLGRLERFKEKSQVINQAMAELATLPYLHDISQQDAKLV